MKKSIESLPDKNTKKGLRVVKQQYYLLKYSQYFQFHNFGVISIEWSRLNTSIISQSKRAIHNWSNEDVNSNYRYLHFQFSQLFAFNKKDFLHIYHSLGSEITVLLNHLDNFHRTTIVPSICNTYYSAIKYLNNVWDESYAIKIEIQIVDHAFVYMKSIQTELDKFKLFNDYLIQLKHKNRIVVPNDQLKPSFAITHAHLFESFPQLQSFEVSSSSQVLIFSQESTEFQSNSQSSVDLGTSEPMTNDCKVCKKSYTHSGGLELHKDRVHRIILQINSALCMNCKGFQLQMNRACGFDAHLHSSIDDQTAPENTKTIEGVKDEENLVLAIVKSGILNGYLVPRETEMMFQRYLACPVTLIF